jgi:hypothetical protein
MAAARSGELRSFDKPGLSVLSDNLKQPVSRFRPRAFGLNKGLVDETGDNRYDRRARLLGHGCDRFKIKSGRENRQSPKRPLLIDVE